MPHRTAFYPCCNTDIAEPLELLRDFADEVVFCDISTSLQKFWERRRQKLQSTVGLPKATFLVEDVRTAIEKLPRIDVLFYRCDSEGEGGSGVFILGDEFLWRIVQRFPDVGGRIITDGSNERGGNFKKMTGRAGMTKRGWHLRPTADQPFLENHQLHIIEVAKAIGSNADGLKSVDGQ